MKSPTVVSAATNMIIAKAAPVGHLSLAPWKKLAMVCGNRTVFGPPSSIGAAKTPMQVRNTRLQPDDDAVARQRQDDPAEAGEGAGAEIGGGVDQVRGIFSIAA